MNDMNIIKLLVKRKTEYKKISNYYLLLNDKRSIHLNNLNYRIPFDIYKKVERIVFDLQNNNPLTKKEIEKKRKELYKKYGYIYYPLMIEKEKRNALKK